MSNSNQTSNASGGITISSVFFPSILRNKFFSSKLALTGLVIFCIISITALFAPWLSSQNPHDLASFSLLDSRLPPGSVGVTGDFYAIGTDQQGRDMLSAIFYGLRISLLVGLCGVLLAMVIGTILGLVSGYYGGKADLIIMRIVDLQLAFPAILLALILLAVLGRGIDKIILALVAVQWVYFARIVRGVTLTEKKKEYVSACHTLGYGSARILLVHILPNTFAPIMIVATAEFAHAIALEAALSFLGVGLPVTEPSLGLLISNGFAYLLNDEYWISIYPGIALLLTVFSLNLIGDHLREILDPRRQK